MGFKDLLKIHIEALYNKKIKCIDIFIRPISTAKSRYLYYFMEFGDKERINYYLYRRKKTLIWLVNNRKFLKRFLVSNNYNMWFKYLKSLQLNRYLPRDESSKIKK